MKIPFTIEQFLEVFKNYNQAVFPMQIAFYLFGFIAIFLTIKPFKYSNRIITMILAFFWLWMGIVYHLQFFSTINKAAYMFGIIFIIQSIFLIILGIIKNEFSFEYLPNKYGNTGIILIVFAMIIYPILGYMFGHRYPSSPSFGLPCPTTIFTFGMLLLSKRVPYLILPIPFFWSIVGFIAALNLGIVEDTGLLISGLVAFPMMIYRNKHSLH